MLSLNQIIKRIKTIALEHAQLRNFYFGNPSDFLTDKTTLYASLFLWDQPGIFDVDGKTTTYNFKAYFLDLENIDEQAQKNTTDVQSDMVQVATDLLALFDFSDYRDWRISTAANFILVEEQFDDWVAGCCIDLAIQVQWTKDVCAVPQNTVTGDITLYWSWFDADPYSDIQNADFLFNRDVVPALPSYALDFVSSGKYLAIKELATEPEKIAWVNTQFNYGVFPDQVFRDSVIIGDYRYYISRIPVVLQDSNTIISFNV